MHLPIEHAVDFKYNEGAQKRNGSGWWGEHPAIELHDEGLDAIGYIYKLEALGGPEEVLRELRIHALSIIQGARLVAEIMGEDEPAVVDCGEL